MIRSRGIQPIGGVPRSSTSALLPDLDLPEFWSVKSRFRKSELVSWEHEKLDRLRSFSLSAISASYAPTHFCVWLLLRHQYHKFICLPTTSKVCPATIASRVHYRDVRHPLHFDGSNESETFCYAPPLTKEKPREAQGPRGFFVLFQRGLAAHRPPALAFGLRLFRSFWHRRRLRRDFGHRLGHCL